MLCSFPGQAPCASEQGSDAERNRDGGRADTANAALASEPQLQLPAAVLRHQPGRPQRRLHPSQPDYPHILPGVAFQSSLQASHLLKSEPNWLRQTIPLLVNSGNVILYLPWFKAETVINIRNVQSQK